MKNTVFGSKDLMKFGLSWYAWTFNIHGMTFHLWNEVWYDFKSQSYEWEVYGSRWKTIKWLMPIKDFRNLDNTCLQKIKKTE